ncbi:hypothetical protein K6119_00565 [Paracrocinitomix mangrovi]|uniref:hypothetical protein n=1 Tax=Paracrocinitomix mangrovi TaxID=2862509 RepID=UPI001C8D7CB1|nr:hypothetical protein [Paracrocinitomix mangrovi]UKN02007.1 hypothetical protein K6119_00565 [Paracrocinitomix mangrovi]
MDKIILAFLLAFSSLSFAQEGVLSIAIYEFQSPELGILNANNDTIVKLDKEDLNHGYYGGDYMYDDHAFYSYEDTLAAGIYKIYVKQGDSVFLERKNILLEDQKKNSINFSLPQMYVMDIVLDTTSFDKDGMPYGTYFAGGFELSSALPTTNNYYNFNGGIKGYYNFNWMANNWFGGGLNYGVSYEYHNLHQADVNGSGVGFQHQYYTYWSGFIGPQAVFSIPEWKPLVILGARYYLPLYTRLNQKDDDLKLKTRDLHNWNDLRVSASMGYNFVHVFAEYRFFTFMKSSLPDIPFLYFGVRFIVGDNL